jgi:hypothetical protein
MRSSSTFHEEMKSIGGIPGLLYETEAAYEEECGHHVDDDIAWWAEYVDQETGAGSILPEQVLFDVGELWARGQDFQSIAIKPLVSRRRPHEEYQGFVDDLSEVMGINIGGALETAADGTGSHGLARAVADLGMDAFGAASDQLGEERP